MMTYERDMRYLIDNFIQADQSRRIDPFENQSLLELIVNTGISEALSKLPQGIQSSKEAVAETIENNVRQKIIKEHLIDPAYFEKMSQLLNTIIAELRADKINFEEYLQKMADLTSKVMDTQRADIPKDVQTPAQRALFHNLSNNVILALECDEAIKYNKLADWRGDERKELVLKEALYKVLDDVAEVERLFPIIKQQSEY